MARLGHRRFGAQGSDWGTSIATSIDQRQPDRVAGIHLMPPLAPPDPATLDDLTGAERAALATLREADEWGSGYSAQQSTRPQTVGYGLVDSPAADGHPCSVSGWVKINKCPSGVRTLKSRIP